jgi:murein DD-endopeptidase MepM/ murein hydrolase activator NlpD
MDRKTLLLAATVFAYSAGSGFAAPPELEVPIACELGRTCFIQNYVEHKTPTGSRDHACGTRTYHAHNGTDFRIPDMAAQRRGVNVLAAAPGTVARLRDGVPDVSVREISPEAVKDRMCGNGLAIAHGDGWETQYCHMEKGSLSVRPGEPVAAGQVLGRVGLSGLTEYPHLHFTVRHAGKVVDPFAQDLAEDSCGEGSALWSGRAQAALAYRASEILNSGFAPRAVTRADVEAGVAALDEDAPVLAAYVRAIGLKKDDVQTMSLTGPNGETLAAETVKPLDSDKAEQFLLIGRKRPPAGWPRGTYTAHYTVERGDAVVLTTAFSHQL